MLNWNETDILNQIAADKTIPADERFRMISENMRDWQAAVHCCPTYAYDASIYQDPEPIDPGVESVKARTPIPGLPGRYVSTGYYD